MANANRDSTHFNGPCESHFHKKSVMKYIYYIDSSDFQNFLKFLKLLLREHFGSITLSSYFILLIAL